MNGRVRGEALFATTVLLVVAAACSGNGSASSEADATTSGISTVEVPVVSEPVRPEGEVADVSEELTGGNGPFIGAATGVEVPEGYVEGEYVATGTATAYRADGPLSADGRWTFEPDTPAPYRTRIIVRRPADSADSSGTVVVEWLNVSGGLDANPDYASLEAEITREAHTWVGVSAQPTSLPAIRIAELYESRDDYEERYEAAVDRVIRAGFVLDDDVPALTAFAEPARVNE